MIKRDHVDILMWAILKPMTKAFLPPNCLRHFSPIQKLTKEIDTSYDLPGQTLFLIGISQLSWKQRQGLKEQLLFCENYEYEGKVSLMTSFTFFDFVSHLCFYDDSLREYLVCYCVNANSQ